MAQLNIIKTILKDSNYHLGLFSREEIEALGEKIFTKLVRNKETLCIRCIVHDKDIGRLNLQEQHSTPRVCPCNNPITIYPPRNTP